LHQNSSVCLNGSAARCEDAALPFRMLFIVIFGCAAETSIY
jgi:hypothetical protein